MEALEVVKSKYILRMWSGQFNPWTPYIVSLYATYFEVSKRDNNLLSSDTQTLKYENVSGVTVDNHIFGCTVIINSSGDKVITIKGLSKENGKFIKEMILDN